MLLVVPTAEENVSHISSGKKVKRKESFCSSKIRLLVSLCSHSVPVIGDSFRKMAVPAAEKREEDVPPTLS